jgi:hypothetical protein
MGVKQSAPLVTIPEAEEAGSHTAPGFPARLTCSPRGILEVVRQEQSMWWLACAGAGGLITLLWLLAPGWRGLLRSYPPEPRDAAAVYWAQHSSSHG